MPQSRRMSLCLLVHADWVQMLRTIKPAIITKNSGQNPGLKASCNRLRISFKAAAFSWALPPRGIRNNRIVDGSWWASDSRGGRAD